MYQRLKDIRKALGMNQTDFAKKLGLSQSTLALIEVGKRNFSEKHIKMICSTFGINEVWLKTGKGEMFEVSPYEKEFLRILDELTPDTQKFLLVMAKELRDTEKKRINENSGE